MDKFKNWIIQNYSKEQLNLFLIKLTLIPLIIPVAVAAARLGILPSQPAAFVIDTIAVGGLLTAIVVGVFFLGSVFFKNESERWFSHIVWHITLSFASSWGIEFFISKVILGYPALPLGYVMAVVVAGLYLFAYTFRITAVWRIYRGY